MARLSPIPTRAVAACAAFQAADSRNTSKTVQHPRCISGDGSNQLVDYAIRMPRTARLSIRDHASYADVSDLSAGLDTETHRGTVRVDRLTGALQARTRLAHRRGRNLEGSFNGGGPILQLNTDRGHIRQRVR